MLDSLFLFALTLLLYTLLGIICIACLICIFLTGSLVLAVLAVVGRELRDRYKLWGLERDRQNRIIAAQKKKWP